MCNQETHRRVIEDLPEVVVQVVQGIGFRIHQVAEVHPIVHKEEDVLYFIKD